MNNILSTTAAIAHPFFDGASRYVSEKCKGKTSVLSNFAETTKNTSSLSGEAEFYKVFLVDTAEQAIIAARVQNVNDSNLSLEEKDEKFRQIQTEHYEKKKR